MIFTILDILQLKKLVTLKIFTALYLRITHTNEYIKEINENKYLIFDSIDKNKALLKKYNDAFDELCIKL